MTLAINRRELLRVLNLPATIPLFDGPFTDRQLRRRELPEPLPYDPARARALLDEAGWRERRAGGVRERGAEPFRFVALVAGSAAFEGMEQMAVYVQQQLRQVGIQFDIEPDAGRRRDRLQAGQFEAAFAGFRHSATWLQQNLRHKNGRLVKLLDLARSTRDPDAMDGIYRQLMAIFRSDLPMTILGPNVRITIAHRRLHGLSSPWRSDPIEHMEDLWLEDRSD